VDLPQRIAYFSMEIGLQSAVPTYSGGLGILAGDTLRAAADLEVPIVAVTLVHRKGYFYQRLDEHGQQHEEPVEWSQDDFLEEMSPRVSVNMAGRTVHIRAWRYAVQGINGYPVPVYLLDTNLPENDPADQILTDQLYGGDLRHRLKQEVILGVGGVRMLRALGYNNISRFHMNEGHASFLTIELLLEEMGKQDLAEPNEQTRAAVREQCVFTTHTPVPAGHDQFPAEMVEEELGPPHVDNCRQFIQDGKLNMTYLALNHSRYVNGVAKKHGEVSRHMFAEYAIDSITNGVHAATFACPAMQEVFDNHIPGWREDNFALRYAINLPRDEVMNAHMTAKRVLIDAINRQTNAGFDVDALTLGFARRAATYKRADLLVSDVDLLKSIASRHGALQIVYAGKAHPHDGGGKEIIKRIHETIERLAPEVKVVYLKNYGFSLGQILTAGVDVWVNTPKRPMEASGTSGMKAALNGVPSLSVLDGWWLEGCIEGVTGWSIGEEEPPKHGDEDVSDAQSMYEKLDHVIFPIFLRDKRQWVNIMRSSIALNGSFFNTHRMMQQYVLNAYFC
jgi:starch phosphorylase